MCTYGTGGTCGLLVYRHVCVDMCVSACLCRRVCRHVHVGSPPRGGPSRTRRTTACMTAPATTTRHHVQLGRAPAMGAPAATTATAPTNPILRRVISSAKSCGKTRLFAIRATRDPLCVRCQLLLTLVRSQVQYSNVCAGICFCWGLLRPVLS